MKRRYFALPLLPLAVIGLAACPNFGVDFCEGADCGADGDGGILDATDEQHVPDGCDLTKDPKDSAACVDDTIGLFVSSTGSDANPGTKEAPLKTIGAAVGKTDSQHTRVYVCAGAYGENVKVATGNKTQGIYAGFSCGDWSYAGGAPNAIVTSNGGYALEVNTLNTTLTVEDMEFDSPDATNPGDSSIAVFMTQSTGVILKRVYAKAGKGADGADAPTVDPDAGSAPRGNDVMEDAGAFGGLACTNGCPNGTSVGAKGGNANLAGGTGTPSIVPTIPNDGSHDGVGGMSSAGSCSSVAHAGSSGLPADGGTTGAATTGILSGTGWSTDIAFAGARGSVGQGGGGGGAGDVPSGGGGGGGCGGCGGAGGAGGGSGGSSFAVLAYQSTLTLDGCAFATGAAGAGKAGGSGQTGQLGGARGVALAAGAGCSGAAGGNGGAGAGGGGGAAGNSIALGYVGTAPTVQSCTFTKGSAGTPGGGGTGAAGNDGLPGADGISAEQQDLKP